MGLDYSSYDFDSALAQLETKLTGTGAWKDRVKSATGQILIRLLSYVIDMDGYKTERRAEESYRRFARLRSSVVELAYNVGYTPRRKVSSVTTLRFETTSPPIVIPEGLVCQSTGGVKFVTTEQGTITGLYVELAAKQGDPKELSFTSDGTADQSFTVPSSDEDVEAVENTSLEVYVNGSLWSEVTSFVGQTATAEVYTVTHKGTSLLIKFGDGSNGKVPPNGETVLIQWLETLGESGDVAGTGTINSIVTAGYSGVTVENTEAAQGGEDEEGIEEIRDNMAQVFATGDRAVTAADYRALLLAYPGVAKANVYGEQEQTTVPDPAYAWVVEIVVVPTGGGTLNRTQENLIEAYLDTKRVITSEITWKDPTYITVDFNVKARINSAYDLDEAQTAIEAALDAILNFTDVDLGEGLRHSDAVAAVEAVEAVASSIVEIFANKDAGDGTGSKTVFASTDPGIGNIPLVPIDRGNVLVFVENLTTGVRRRVGYDDGSGNFTSSALVTTPRVTGGTINYATGAFSITFNGTGPPATEKVVIQYQTGAAASTIIGDGDAVETDFTGILERNLSPSFIDIYREGILVGSDDGAGNIIDGGGGDISGGTVNYTTGDIEVQFASAPASEAQISAEYYYENQDIETSLDQMLLMGVKTVSVKVAS